MNILIVNDDGLLSFGLSVLVKRLSKSNDITVVVPEREQSGKSHSMTFTEPLFCRHHYIDTIKQDVYCVSGTPADCVILAIEKLMDNKPDILISGINKGYNTGNAILYSGTVSAAFEGAKRGIPSFAVSASYFENNLHEIADYTIQIINHVMNNDDSVFLYNINFPDSGNGPYRGIKAVSIADDRIVEKIEKRIDPFEREYYWYSADFHAKKIEYDFETDMGAIDRGYISVTPIKPHYFDRERFETADIISKQLNKELFHKKVIKN